MGLLLAKKVTLLAGASQRCQEHPGVNAAELRPVKKNRYIAGIVLAW